MFDLSLSLHRKSALLTSLLGAVFLLSRNLHGMTTDEFLGVWHQTNRPEYVFLFAPDGTLSSGTMKDGKTFDGDTKIDHWTLQPNGELTIMSANSSAPASCTIVGKELVVKLAHLQPYRFMREVPKATPPPAYESWFSEQLRYAGDETDDKSAQPSVATTMPSPPPAATASAPAIQPTADTAVRAVPASAANGRSVSAAEVNGTWRVKESEIKILALGQGKLRVQFDLVQAVGKTANTGFALGEATIENDVATFIHGSSNDCTITLKFLPNGRLQVDQHGFECGFGNRVYADGTFRKVSDVKPTFDDSR
jgi:hypothetical protein